MPRVDQQHREAARVEQLEQGYPVHAGGLHGHRVNAALAEPVGHAFKVGGEAVELAHRLVVAMGRHGHEVRGAADVDAGRVGVGQGQRRGPAAADGPLLALCHGVLHHEVVERDAEVGYVVLITLSNGMTAREPDSSREDSPMSMTQPMTTLTRGQCAPLLQWSSPASRSTLPQRRQGEFLRSDLRRGRADYFANPSIEGMPKRLRLLVTPHVKRWAS
jgi:hypothetical protein